ncbi:MAG: hypothetical protein ABEJ98_03340 [Candidatus Nanohaloarchaea archaeon]
MTDSKIKEWGAGGVTGLIGFAFILTSALAFGHLDTITSILTDLTQTSFALGPFDLSPALIGSVILVGISGGVNAFGFGANSQENTYATLGLASLFLLMGLPSFASWVLSNSAIGMILFFLSIAAYSVIGGVGINDDKNESIVGNATSKITGGYL